MGIVIGILWNLLNLGQLNFVINFIRATIGTSTFLAVFGSSMVGVLVIESFFKEKK